jgi:hypothetical protein
MSVGTISDQAPQVDDTTAGKAKLREQRSVAENDDA